MSAAAQLLDQVLGGPGWSLQKPADGMQRDAYVARQGDREVFVKLDVSSSAFPALKRLGEIGVAPPMLEAGTRQGRSFIIQSYISGTSPARPWFRAHLPELARLLGTYHGDRALAAMLTTEDVSHAHDIQARMDDLARQLRDVDPVLFGREEVAGALALLRKQANDLPARPLVPTHGDPNSKNLLLAGDRLYLVDWDDIALSDPLRDIGLLLWWYVPVDSWDRFFTTYNPAADFHAAKNGIYWWAAYRSLSVALFLDRQSNGPGAEAFLSDFVAAAHGRENPRL